MTGGIGYVDVDESPDADGNIRDDNVGLVRDGGNPLRRPS
jgi:hypothetical protein